MMQAALRYVVFAMIICVSLSVFAQETEDQVLALVGARLIDGTGSAPIENSLVIVDGDRIVHVGDQQSADIPANAEIMYLNGYSLLPGFINSHVHQGLSTNNLRQWAADGVTTVRDIGCGPTSLAVYRSLMTPSPDLARLVAAGPLITVPNGYPIVPFGAAWSLPVTSVEQARQAAEELFDVQGVDLLKISLESADGSIAVMNRNLARELVAVAHERGSVASAHVSVAADLDRALDVGVDDLAHMIRDSALTADEIVRVVNDGVAWVPTLELWQCVGNVDLMWAQFNLRNFVDAGGTVALGTDFAGYTCDWELGMPMTEMRLMAASGMSNNEILTSATLNGAKVSNLVDELGSVSIGKIADLIAVTGNPLDDLEVLDDVRLVVHDGVIIHNTVVPLSLVPPRRGSMRIP